MNAETQNVPRRKRKPQPRRVPALIEQREQKPFIFGWGAHLNNRERESLKERIALFGGIVLTVVLAAIIGWGWYQDNIQGPANVRARNNRAVAQVGASTITVASYKRFEHFQDQQLANNLSQLQQQQSALQSDPKKNSAQLAAIGSEVSSIQSQQQSLPQSSLEALINQDTILQKASKAGVSVSPKDVDKEMTQIAKQAGGKLHLQQYINGMGLSIPEYRTLVKSDLLQQKLQKKLAASVSPNQWKVRASHILLASKDHAKAVKLLNQVKHGANFAALAKKYSIDKTSGAKGGDLGYFAHGVMVAPFEKAAFSMKPGQIRLVKSQFGWHIIKVTGRKYVHLSKTELQQAQQQAYATWLSKQKTSLHVQRYIDVTTLVAAPTPNPLSGLTNSQLPTSQQPSSGVTTGTNGSKVVSPAKPQKGKSSTAKGSSGSTGTGSTGTKSTGKNSAKGSKK